MSVTSSPSQPEYEENAEDQVDDRLIGREFHIILSWTIIGATALAAVAILSYLLWLWSRP